MSVMTVALYYETFTIIIYDRNDIGLYYKTMILAKLAYLGA
jgi:hypothetical protein